MHVELRPHTGRNAATKRTEDLGQDRIYVDGFCFGYVARKPDAPICLIDPDPTEEMKEAIRVAVVAKYGGKALHISVPPPLPEEDDDEDEYHDDIV